MIDRFNEVLRSQDEELLTLLTLATLNIRSNRVSILPALGMAFDMKDLSKLAHLFGGCTITIPTPEDLNKALTEILCLYYRKFCDMEWPEVHRRVPQEFDTQGMSRRVNNLYDKISPEVAAMFEDLYLRDKKETPHAD